MATKKKSTKKVKTPRTPELQAVMDKMDAEGTLAESSLRALWLEHEDDEGMLILLGWWKAWYMTAGHKRLGRAMVSLAKGLEKKLPAKASVVTVPQKGFDGTKDPLPAWASRKSHAQQTAENLAKKAAEEFKAALDKAAKACLPCTKPTAKGKKTPGKPSRKPVRKVK